MQHQTSVNGLKPGSAWGVVASPFGAYFLAWSKGGLMEAGFVDSDARASRWNAFSRNQDDLKAKEFANAIFTNSISKLQLDIMGTPFQCKVWNALQMIPLGECVSYSEIASQLGIPKAVRAVASAIARNPIAVIIPCHRVVPMHGGMGEYRWGASRKSSLLEWERTCILKA